MSPTGLSSAAYPLLSLGSTGTFDFLAWGANEAGETIRPWQSGDVRQYAVWFLTGAIALTLILLAI